MIVRHHQSGSTRPPSSTTTRPTTSTPLVPRASTAAKGKATTTTVITDTPHPPRDTASSSSSRARSHPSTISSRTSSVPFPSMNGNISHRSHSPPPAPPRACTPVLQPTTFAAPAAASTSKKRHRPPSTLDSSSPPPRFFRQGRLLYTYKVFKRKVSPSARGSSTLKDKLEGASSEDGSQEGRPSSRITAWLQTTTSTTVTTKVSYSSSSSSHSPPHLPAPVGTFGPSFGKIFGDTQGASPAAAPKKANEKASADTTSDCTPAAASASTSGPLFSPSLVSRQQPKTLAGAPDLSVYLDPLYGIPSATRSREEIERRNAFEEQRRCKLEEEGRRARRHTTAATLAGSSGRPHAKLPSRRQGESKSKRQADANEEHDDILSDIPSSLSFARCPSSTANATPSTTVVHRHLISIVPATPEEQPQDEDEQDYSAAYDAYITDGDDENVFTSAPTPGGIVTSTHDYTWSPAPSARAPATPSPPPRHRRESGASWSPVTTPGVHSQTKSVRRGWKKGKATATGMDADPFADTASMAPPLLARSLSEDPGYEADDDKGIGADDGSEDTSEEGKTAKLLAAQRMMNQIMAKARAHQQPVAAPSPRRHPIKIRLRHADSSSRRTEGAQAIRDPRHLLPTLSHEPQDRLVAELCSGDEAGPNSSIGSAGFDRSTPSLLQDGGGGGSTFATIGHSGGTTRSSSSQSQNDLRTPSLGDCGPTQPHWTPKAEEQEDPFTYSLRDSLVVPDAEEDYSHDTSGRAEYYDWSQEEEFVRVLKPSSSSSFPPKRSSPIAITVQQTPRHRQSCEQPRQLAAPAAASRPVLRRRNAATPEDFDDAHKAASAVAANLDIDTSLTQDFSDAFVTAQADLDQEEADDDAEMGDVTRAYMAAAKHNVVEGFGGVDGGDSWSARGNEAFARYLVELKKWDNGERDTPPTPATRASPAEGLYGSLPLCETPSPLDLDGDEVMAPAQDEEGGPREDAHGTATILSSETQARFPLATSSSSSATPHAQLARTSELRNGMPTTTTPSRGVTMSTSSSSSIWWGPWKDNAITSTTAHANTSAFSHATATDMSAQVDADFPLLRITLSEPSPGSASDTPRRGGSHTSQELDAARGIVMLGSEEPERGRQMVSPPPRRRGPEPKTIKHTPSSTSSSSRFAVTRRRIGAKLEEVVRRSWAAGGALEKRQREDEDHDVDEPRMMLRSTPPPAALRRENGARTSLFSKPSSSSFALPFPASQQQRFDLQPSTSTSSLRSFAASSSAAPLEEDVHQASSSSSCRRTTSQLLHRLRSTPSSLFAAAVRRGSRGRLAHASSDATMRTATPPPSDHRASAPAAPYEVVLQQEQQQQQRRPWQISRALSTPAGYEPRSASYAPSPSSSRFPDRPTVTITEGNLDLSHFATVASADDDDEEGESTSADEEEEGSDGYGQGDEYEDEALAAAPASEEVVRASEDTFGTCMDIDSDFEEESEDDSEAGLESEEDQDQDQDVVGAAAAQDQAARGVDGGDGDGDAMSVDRKRSDVSMRTRTTTGPDEVSSAAREDADGSGGTSSSSFAEASAALAWPMPPPPPPPSAVYWLLRDQWQGEMGRGSLSTSTSTESMRFP